MFLNCVEFVVVKKMKIRCPRYNKYNLVVVIISALLMLVLFVPNEKISIGWDFRNNLWGPTHLLIQKKSPYKINLLFDVGNAVWMPMIIGLFFPLGLLPLQQSNNIWFLINLISLLLIVWMSSENQRPLFTSFVLAITLSVLFPPTISHFKLGQTTLLIILIFLTIVFGEDKIPLSLLAFLVAIGLSKPQLAILALPGFLFHIVRVDGVKKAFLFTILLFVSILVLISPLFLFFPNWFSDFIAALQRNPSWAHPSSLNILRHIIPKYSEIIWTFLGIFIFSLNIWIWKTQPKQKAILWSLSLTPLVASYIWTWDFVLLLPLFVNHLFQSKSKLSLTILIGGYLVCWFIVVNMKFHGKVNDELYWWIPWYFNTIILLNEYANKASQFGDKLTRL